MNTASIFAEAIRRNEPIDRVRDRFAARDHLMKNYPAIALPALKAAMEGKAIFAKPARPKRHHHPIRRGPIETGEV